MHKHAKEYRDEAIQLRRKDSSYVWISRRREEERAEGMMRFGSRFEILLFIEFKKSFGSSRTDPTKFVNGEVLVTVVALFRF